MSIGISPSPIHASEHQYITKMRTLDSPWLWARRSYNLFIESATAAYPKRKLVFGSQPNLNPPRMILILMSGKDVDGSGTVGLGEYSITPKKGCKHGIDD